VQVFTLEAFNAEEGDCFLLAFGDQSEPQFILVDGGPGRTTYDDRLKPRLDELTSRHGRIELPLVGCSHIDSDHIGGLVALLDDVVYGGTPISIDCLWHNRPLDLVGERDAQRFAAIVRADQEYERYATDESRYFAERNWEVDAAYMHVLASVEEGDKLYDAAENGKIPINCGFDGVVMAPTPETGAAVYDIGDLRLTVLGPDREQLEALRKKWEEETKGQSLESLFAQSERIAAIVAADDDRSVTNLSSIVFLAEFAGRSILMTGDARALHPGGSRPRRAALWREAAHRRAEAATPREHPQCRRGVLRGSHRRRVRDLGKRRVPQPRRRDARRPRRGA
jgi:hypothetical protein